MTTLEAFDSTLCFTSYFFKQLQNVGKVTPRFVKPTNPSQRRSAVPAQRVPFSHRVQQFALCSDAAANSVKEVDDSFIA